MRHVYHTRGIRYKEKYQSRQFGRRKSQILHKNGPNSFYCTINYTRTINLHILYILIYNTYYHKIRKIEDNNFSPTIFLSIPKLQVSKYLPSVFEQRPPSPAVTGIYAMKTLSPLDFYTNGRVGIQPRSFSSRDTAYKHFGNSINVYTICSGGYHFTITV